MDATVIKLLIIGQLITILLSMLKQLNHSVKITCFTAWLLSLIGYLAIPISTHGSYWHMLLAVFSHCVPVFFWLTTRLLFSDRKHLDHYEYLITGIFIIWAIIDAITHNSNDFSSVNFLLLTATKLLLVVWALYGLLLQRQQDLLETRRLFSLWVIIISGFYSLLVIIVETLLPLQIRIDLDGVNSIGIAVLTMVVTTLFLSPSQSFREWLDDGNTLSTIGLPAPAIPKASPETNYSVSATEDKKLATLQHLLNQGIYRQGGLAIGGLAKQMDMPEYKLRQLINQQLGFKNFNEFLNHYRIEEAKNRLQIDKQPITTIALDIGYRSLSTFNKAFKEVTNCTPSQFKRLNTD